MTVECSDRNSTIRRIHHLTIYPAYMLALTASGLLALEQSAGQARASDKP